jgi:hypothetical protein
VVGAVVVVGVVVGGVMADVLTGPVVVAVAGGVVGDGAAVVPAVDPDTSVVVSSPRPLGV